jgi:hypothetical protein
VTIRPAYAHLIPEDVRAKTAATKAAIDWSAPFHPNDDLRITTPIAKARLPKADRRHLAAMPAERRARLEREWMDAENAVPSCADPISAEIKARAAAEWEAS